MKAIRIHSYGGPEALKYEDAPVPAPGKGEALVKIAAAGVNFIDIYFRTGVFKSTQFPFTPGHEGAGAVSAVGEGVTEVKVGDRVAYAMAIGAYAEFAVVPAWRLVALPSNVDYKVGAAIMLQGMTAHYLTHSTFPLKPGHKALVHAAEAIRRCRCPNVSASWSAMATSANQAPDLTFERNQRILRQILRLK